MTTLGNTYIGLSMLCAALACLMLARSPELRQEIADTWWSMVGIVYGLIGRRIGMDEPDEHEDESI